MSSRKQVVSAGPNVNVAEFGVSRSALAIRSGMALGALRRLPGQRPVGPTVAPADGLAGPAAVNRAALIASAHPASHQDPLAEQSSVNVLAADIAALPRADRTALRSVVTGMLNRAHQFSFGPGAMVVVMVVLGLVFGTNVGQAAAHTVAEITTTVVTRTVEKVAPVVRRIPHVPVPAVRDAVSLPATGSSAPAAGSVVPATDDAPSLGTSTPGRGSGPGRAAAVAGPIVPGAVVAEDARASTGRLGRGHAKGAEKRAHSQGPRSAKGRSKGRPAMSTTAHSSAKTRPAGHASGNSQATKRTESSDKKKSSSAEGKSPAKARSTRRN
ncbi:hypothetical protein GCM10009682_52710 [Luedemannella flava]|uniref:Uncharacterized protein n=1 Tax=Luedemannella flava TaxID=349316 RepID=A0ABN2MGU1_9ACTN